MVSEAYQALKANGKSIQRTVLVVDKGGRVQYVKQSMPKNSELLEAIRGVDG